MAAIFTVFSYSPPPSRSSFEEPFGSAQDSPHPAPNGQTGFRGLFPPAAMWTPRNQDAKTVELKALSEPGAPARAVSVPGDARDLHAFDAQSVRLSTVGDFHAVSILDAMKRLEARHQHLNSL